MDLSLLSGLVFRQSCFDVWHSRPRLCELPYTTEDGCATWDHRFIHQTMLDRALATQWAWQKFLANAVILSAAKNLAFFEGYEILRCAQNDRDRQKTLPRPITIRKSGGAVPAA